MPATDQYKYLEWTSIRTWEWDAWREQNETKHYREELTSNHLRWSKLGTKIHCRKNNSSKSETRKYAQNNAEIKQRNNHSHM